MRSILRKLNMAHANQMAYLIENDTYFSSWTPDGLKKFLSIKTVKAWGIFFHNELVSFIVFQIAGHESEMIMLFVEQKHRQSGLATQLLNMVLSMFLEKGITDISLEVSTINKSAVAFYRKNKFRIVGRRKNYYSYPRPHDAFLMSLTLQS